MRQEYQEQAKIRKRKEGRKEKQRVNVGKQTEEEN